MSDGLDSNAICPQCSRLNDARIKLAENLETARVQIAGDRETILNLHKANAEMIADRQRLVEQITRLADMAREIVLECDPLSSWVEKFWESGLTGFHKKARKGPKK